MPTVLNRHMRNQIGLAALVGIGLAGGDDALPVVADPTTSSTGQAPPPRGSTSGGPEGPDLGSSSGAVGGSTSGTTDGGAAASSSSGEVDVGTIPADLPLFAEVIPPGDLPHCTTSGGLGPGEPGSRRPT